MRRWKRLVAVPHGDEALVDLAAEYVAAKVAAEELEAKRKVLRDQLLDSLINGEAIVFLDEDGHQHTVKAVDRSLDEVDERELLRGLTDDQFDQVTVAKLDKKLLAEAIESGLVAPEQVDPHYREKISRSITTHRRKP